MAYTAFLGYALVGLGPALAILVTQILHRPFLVLVALSSAFFWLVALILLALLWRPFLPHALSPLSGLALLLSAVLAQELLRQRVLVQALRWLEDALNQIAAATSLPKLSLLDKVRISTATGFGHGAAHAMFFFLSITTPALGPATLYSDVCPAAPFFLLVAILSAAFTIIHTTTSVTTAMLHHQPKGLHNLAFSAETYALLSSQYSEEAEHSLLPPSWGVSSSLNHLLVPGLHFMAAASTLINFLPGGCYAGIPLVWLFAVASCILCVMAIEFSHKRSQPASDSSIP